MKAPTAAADQVQVEKPVDIAILGCGTITRRRHLPAAADCAGVNLVAVVDSNAERARAECQSQGVHCDVVEDYRAILGRVQAVINALPNHLHTPVNLECLAAGIHVLCEKPLATCGADALACCELAQQKGAVLAAAMPRRFYESTALLQLVLGSGVLGSLESYDWEHGMPFDWPSATGFYFSRARAGGGVLLDEGVHLLDCLLDWFGPVSAFQYQDDNLGSGIEANVVLSLRHQWGGGEVPGRVRLSRMYALKNRLVVRGAKARAVILRNDPAVVVLHTDLAGKEVTMTLRLPEDSPSKQKDPFGAMLEDFVQSIRTGQKPAVDGWKALETIQLMERCYQEAQRIPEPWFEITSMERNLNR